VGAGVPVHVPGFAVSVLAPWRTPVIVAPLTLSGAMPTTAVWMLAAVALPCALVKVTVPRSVAPRSAAIGW